MAAGRKTPGIQSHGEQGVAAGDLALPIIADGEWRGGRGLTPGVRGGVPPRPPREPDGGDGASGGAITVRGGQGQLGPGRGV